MEIMNNVLEPNNEQGWQSFAEVRNEAIAEFSDKNNLGATFASNE